jgi:hypothetical protein
MPEKIEPTWIAYALAAPTSPEAIKAAIDRIERHYADLVDYPTSRHACLGDRRGIGVIADAEPQCRWPHFATSADLAIATAYVPTDWQRLIGECPATHAPLPLARSIRAAPARAIEALSAPFVAAVFDRSGDELLIINDCIGAGRCYELVFEGGRAWSNRVGALPLFVGLEARANLRGWLTLAAATWFIGNSTPIAGVTRVPPGSVVRAKDEALSREQTPAVSNLVAPASLALDEAVEAAGVQMRAQAATAGELWPRAALVDLSGGHDSRLAAAAAIAAKLDARFHTSDKTPGEAAVARELVARAPQPLKHRIRHTGDEDSTPSAPLRERALRLHLLHDGMRHPQKLRSNLKLPRSRPSRATLSGHGGEIAHGFFYKTRRDLKQIRRGGDHALVSRLLRFFTKRHKAAKTEAYELAQAEIERTISEGLDVGLEGPQLLDWFYLMDRFAHRSGLASHAERVSVFATPAFIRAAFALTPQQRLDAVLHRELVSQLVPAWQDVPFFKAERTRMPSIRRRRLWEHAPDAAAVERILIDDGPWAEIYDADRVRQAWSEVQAGEGSANWESIFEGVVYRVAYEDYLRILNDHSRQGPRLIDAVGVTAPPA